MRDIDTPLNVSSVLSSLCTTSESEGKRYFLHALCSWLHKTLESTMSPLPLMGRSTSVCMPGRRSDPDSRPRTASEANAGSDSFCLAMAS
jgi:hypothetical protein